MSTKKRFDGHRIALGQGIAIAALLAAGGVSAQVVPTAEPVQASTDVEPAAHLDEVIVTAQRRRERLEDVPMAVVALSAETLEKSGVTGIHELSRITPGVQVNFGGGYTQPSIRGVTSLTNGTGNENNIAIYVDGFYVSDTISINSDIANISGIEVLKGPQGTLYGRNATGGAILINTLAPSEHLTGKAEVGYASFNEWHASGYVSGALSDRVRGSLAAAVREGEGYIRMSDPARVGGKAGNAAPLEQRSLRAKLEADLTSNLTATLGYAYGFSSDARGLLFSTFDHQPATFPAPPLRPTEFGTAAYNYETRNESIGHDGTLMLSYQTPIGVLRSYTGYGTRELRVDYDFDGTYADLTSARTWGQQEAFQQSLDYSIDAIDRLDLVIGASYYDSEYAPLDPHGLLTNYGPGRVMTSNTKVTLGTQALAFYIDGAYQLTDRLTVTLGGRYSSETKTAEQIGVNGAGVITFPLTRREADFEQFTPRASIRYQLSPGSNVYASYSEGFRSGSFNAVGASRPELLLPIDPELIKAYEVGYKTARAGIRFDVSAFYYDYTDLNVSLTLPDPNCVGGACPIVTIIGNAPEAEVYGLDAQASFTPVERLDVTAGLAFLHARYGDFPNAVGTGLNGATGLNASGQIQDWTDQQMARAPDFSGFVSADYTFPAFSGEMRLSGNINYSDGYVISNPSLYGPLAAPELRNKQRFRQDATTLVNASATWTNPTGQYFVSVFGKNLTDVNYRSTYNGAVFGDYSTKAAPRTWGVRLGYNF